MAEHIGVREFGFACDAHARQRLVDQEQRRLVGIAVDIGVDDDVVGDVAGGHEPFLAVEDEASVAAVGARADHARIRAGAAASVTATQARRSIAQLGLR